MLTRPLARPPPRPCCCSPPPASVSVSAQSSAQPSLARSSPALEAGTRQAASRMSATVLASLLNTASSYSILR